MNKKFTKCDPVQRLKWWALQERSRLVRTMMTTSKAWTNRVSAVEKAGK